MKSSKRIKYTVFGLLLAFLLPSLVIASGRLNTLTIIKLLNQSTHFINEIPRDSQGPVSDATYRIWRIGDTDLSTSQKDFDRMLRDLGIKTLEDLDNDYPDPTQKNSEKTDLNGKTTIKDLPDGRYYIREIILEENGIIDNEYSIPFIVDLPLYTNSEFNNDVSVFPKSSQPDSPYEPEEPGEQTGGEKFKKVDDNRKPLKGAKFKVVDRVEDEYDNYIKDSTGNYIYEPVIRDKKVIILTSDENGRFEIKGLPYGVYWLVETKAPDGFRILPEPIQFNVTNTSYDDSVIIEIENIRSEKPPGEPDVPEPPKKIPQTGDIELFLIMMAGVAMIILGVSITRTREQY